jgi:hypothetical protein
MNLPDVPSEQLCQTEKESPKTMQTKRKTMIVTDGSQGIGADVMSREKCCKFPESVAGA